MDQTASAPLTKRDVPGIVNFSSVNGNVGFAGSLVGFGGMTEPSAMAGLKRDGFRSVINLRVADEPGANMDSSRTAAEAAGLKFIHLPFAKNPDPLLVDNFLSAVADTANQPVYIYCHSANRAGALWMIARVLKDGWEIEKAGDEAVAIGLTDAGVKTWATEYITRSSAKSK